jgi:hypothetical protein
MALDDKRVEAVKKFREALKKDEALATLFSDAFPGLAGRLLQEDDVTMQDLESISGGPSWDVAEIPMRKQ